MTIIRVSEEDLLARGLKSVGFDSYGQESNCLKTKILRFRASFGCDPKTCAAVFTEIQSIDLEGSCVKYHDVNYFLMTLNWLKSYKTEAEISGVFNVTEKTLRQWIWNYTKSIQALKEKKVS